MLACCRRGSADVDLYFARQAIIPRNYLPTVSSDARLRPPACNRSLSPKPSPSALHACLDSDELRSGTARHVLLETHDAPLTQAFRRHHDDVHISSGNDSALMNREAMREE
jgi:hypothetical protein